MAKGYGLERAARQYNNDNADDPQSANKIYNIFVCTAKIKSTTVAIATASVLLSTMSSSIQPTVVAQTPLQTTSIPASLPSESWSSLPTSNSALEPSSTTPVWTIELASSQSTPTEGLSSSFSRTTSHRASATTSSITFTKGHSKFYEILHNFQNHNFTFAISPKVPIVQDPESSWTIPWITQGTRGYPVRACTDLSAGPYHRKLSTLSCPLSTGLEARVQVRTFNELQNFFSKTISIHSWL